MAKASMGVLTILYPVVVFYSIQANFVWAPITVLVVLMYARALQSGCSRSTLGWLGLVMIGAVLILTLFGIDIEIFKFYPAIVSLLVASVFLMSLRRRETALEVLASRFVDLDGEVGARSYIRRLTFAWGIVVAANSIVAAWTAIYSTNEFWVLYNTVYSYCFMGMFAAIEWLYRQSYKRRKAS